MAFDLENSIGKSNLYTPEAVAEKLSVTTRCVRKWLREKKLRGVKIGKLWRIRPEDLAAFIDPVAYLLETARIDNTPMCAEDIQLIKDAKEDIKHNRVMTMKQIEKDLGL